MNATGTPHTASMVQYVAILRLVLLPVTVLVLVLKAPFVQVNRQDQLRGENEVCYQHKCRTNPSAGPEGAHKAQPDTSFENRSEFSPLEVSLAFIISFSI